MATTPSALPTPLPLSIPGPFLTPMKVSSSSAPTFSHNTNFSFQAGSQLGQPHTEKAVSLWWVITNLCSALLASDGLLVWSGSEGDMGSLSTELEPTAQVFSSLRYLPSLSYSCGYSKSVPLSFKPVRLWVFCPHFHIPMAHAAAKLPLVQGMLEPLPHHLSLKAPPQHPLALAHSPMPFIVVSICVQSLQL